MNTRRKRGEPAPGVMIINIPIRRNLTTEEIEVLMVRLIGLAAQSLSLRDQKTLYRAMAKRCTELAILASHAIKD